MIFIRELFSRSAKKHPPHPTHLMAQEKTVDQIMIPRANILYAPDHLDQKNVLELLLKQKYQAIPVCHKTLDTIKGVIDLYTLSTLSKSKQDQWRRHLSKPFFVPTSMRIPEAAKLLNTSGALFLLVVDEYGDVKGLVTRRHLLGALTPHSKVDLPSPPKPK